MERNIFRINRLELTLKIEIHGIAALISIFNMLVRALYNLKVVILFINEKLIFICTYI